jgi:formate dehydrogenase iron-sulfur subunit
MQRVLPSAAGARDAERLLNDADIQRAVSHALQKHAAEPGPLLEILHAVQDALGHAPAGT